MGMFQDLWFEVEIRGRWEFSGFFGFIRGFFHSFRVFLFFFRFLNFLGLIIVGALGIAIGIPLLIAFGLPVYFITY
jgi:hypothetical protein